jgi:hypothetical protein
MTAARPVVAQEWLPVLVAPFAVLLFRSNQLRAVMPVVMRGPSSGPAKAQPHPNLTQAGLLARSANQLRAQFARWPLRP